MSDHTEGIDIDIRHSNPQLLSQDHVQRSVSSALSPIFRISLQIRFNMHIIIMGAGIAGLTSALALKKHLPDPQPTITIVEVRSAPSTIGGAVNLTPKALRYLSHLEVYDIILSKGYGADCQGIDVFDLYTGSRVAEVSFRGADGKGIGKGESKKFFSRRVMRRHLQESLLEAVNSLEDTTILWGKKVNKIMESRSADGVQLIFEDGDDLACDLLLGCDVGCMAQSF